MAESEGMGEKGMGEMGMSVKMMPRAKPRVYLSPPHMSGLERTYVVDAFDTNWIAPLGPHVDAFEREFCELTGAGHAAALVSGTAALHNM